MTLGDFDRHLAEHRYLLGGRPCIGDFGLFGPLVRASVSRSRFRQVDALASAPQRRLGGANAGWAPYNVETSC